MKRRRPRPGFALALLALGCHGQSLTLGMADGAARSQAGDGAAEAAALDTPAPAGPDAAADLAASAPPDATPPAPLDASLAVDSGTEPAAAALDTYHQLLDQIELRYEERRAGCFGSPLGLLTNPHNFPQPPEDYLLQSLRLGLRRLDQAAARSCVEALAAAPCEVIADIFARGGPTERTAGVPACADVLVGTVPPGGVCLLDEDCRSPEQFNCRGGDFVCQVCTPRTRLRMGDGCSPGAGDCPLGTACRPDPRDANASVCLPLGQSRETCHDHTDCAPGLLCGLKDPQAVEDGFCRPQAVGTPCAGGWECLYVHACVGVGPDHGGTCQVGKPLGAPCAVYREDVNGNRYSDCADLLQCLDLDGKGPRCVSGNKLGQPCGPLPPPNQDSWIECLEGFCTATSDHPKGTCVPYKPAGQPCRSDDECQRGLLCPGRGDTPGVCTPPPRPAPTGAPCDLISPGSTCGPGAYCAFPAGADPLAPTVPEKGVCAPWRRIGESCRESADVCEPLARCVDGVCRRC